MQYLQEGLRDGEECLFVSTEQTIADLQQSFDGFDFDLDHSALDITTVHATPGKTLDSEEEVMTLDTLSEGEEGLGGGFTAPFTGEYVQEYVSRFAPKDRIVFDSISGLRAVAEDMSRFRRVTIDLMRKFVDEFGATTLLIAEEDAPESDAIRYNAHGVVRVWRDTVDGDLQRFLQVEKMRGVNHDSRKFLIDIGADGIKIVPRRRTPTISSKTSNTVSTGLPGLDNLLGGGIETGRIAILEHDSRASRSELLDAMISTSHRNGGVIVFVPPANSTPDGLEERFANRVGELPDLLDQDELFLLDFHGVFDIDHRNVFSFNDDSPDAFEGVMGVIEALSRISKERNDRPVYLVFNTKSLLTELDVADVKRVRQWMSVNLLGEEDVSLFVHDPGLLPDRLSGHLVDEAGQVLQTKLQEGLQFVSLEKAPSGNLGSTRYIEYVDSEPFVRVQSTG
jgi:circadian clock protein KaiC